jgi:hypothetical protein
MRFVLLLVALVGCGQEKVTTESTLAAKHWIAPCRDMNLALGEDFPLPIGKQKIARISVTYDNVPFILTSDKGRVDYQSSGGTPWVLPRRAPQKWKALTGSMTSLAAEEMTGLWKVELVNPQTGYATMFRRTYSDLEPAMSEGRDPVRAAQKVSPDADAGPVAATYWGSLFFVGRRNNRLYWVTKAKKEADLEANNWAEIGRFAGDPIFDIAALSSPRLRVVAATSTGLKSVSLGSDGSTWGGVEDMAAPDGLVRLAYAPNGLLWAASDPDKKDGGQLYVTDPRYVTWTPIEGLKDVVDMSVSKDGLWVVRDSPGGQRVTFFSNAVLLRCTSMYR